MAGTFGGVCGLLSGFLIIWKHFSGEASVRVGGHSGAVQRRGLESYAGTVFFCAVALAALSAGCFAIEAVYMGYIPLLLRGVPHAYSYFHVTGLHYLTVSCVLVPALSVIYFSHRGRSQPGTAGMYASGRCSGGGDSASVRVTLPASVCGTAGIDYLHTDGTPAESDLCCFCLLAGLIVLYILLTSRAAMILPT